MKPYVICNGVVDNEERTGWELECPECAEKIRYTVLNVSPGEDVFLYCDQSSDFILRDEDSGSVHQIDKANEEELVDGMRTLYQNLEGNLPPCPSGGHFRIWSNVKCPHCSYEFPYNNGLKNEALRYMESSIIWIEGAVSYRGASRPSNRLIKVKVRP